jgi:hypothetical protein
MIEIELHILHPACLKILHARADFWWHKQAVKAPHLMDSKYVFIHKMWKKYAVAIEVLAVRQEKFKRTHTGETPTFMKRAPTI